MYTLLDGQAQHAKTPDTFHIPDEQEITAIKAGTIVKLGFREEGAMSERMWVKVLQVTPDGFEGELDNEPFDLQSLALGDRVAFKAKHILSIWD